MKDVDSMFPKPAAVTLNKTRLEKQQVRTFKSNGDSWRQSLDNLSPFTIKGIEQHRLNSGKTPESAIIKTLDKGRKFKYELYISADTLYTKWDNECFFVKCECKASIKKEKRRVTVKLKLICSRVGQIGIEPREKYKKFVQVIIYLKTVPFGV